MKSRFVDALKGIATGKDEGGFAQFIRYCAVGGAAAAVEIGFFALLSNILGVYHIVANTIAFVAGVLVNFFLSGSWVFGERKRLLSPHFALFLGIGVVGLLLSDGILYILIDAGLFSFFFRGVDAPGVKLFSKMAAVALVLLWNFGARKKWVFGTRGRQRSLIGKGAHDPIDHAGSKG
jgi:putative flippase GtrA